MTEFERNHCVTCISDVLDILTDIMEEHGDLFIQGPWLETSLYLALHEHPDGEYYLQFELEEQR